MKRIAVPTRDNKVDEHFGHCEYYTIFEVTDDKTIANTELLPSPQGCGCKSNIASVLANMGVSVLLGGNMGKGAKANLEKAGLTVFTGFEGDVSEAVKKYNGGFTGAFIMCNGHGEDHQCENH